MASAFNSQGSLPGGITRPSSIPGSTPQANALNGAQGMVLPTAPSQPSHPIASQVHTDAAGNSVKTTFAVPKTEGMLSQQNSQQNQTVSPLNIKMINGMHHVPFTSADGTIKYINAKGQVIS